MAINAHNKTKLLARLSRVSGHLAAVERMVADERYCIDVLHQIKAVQAALDGVSEDILKQHLRTCVVDAIQNQDEDRVLDELVSIFKKAPNLALTEDDLQPLLKHPTVKAKGLASKPAQAPTQSGCCG